MNQFNQEFMAFAFPDLVAEFGGEITYRKSNLSTRTIDAIVVTDPLGIQALMADAPAVKCLLRTANSAVRGIIASELDLGNDQVDVSLRDGEPVRPVTIKQLVSDKGGVTTVACY